MLIQKKDGSVKLIPAFRPVASNSGSDAGSTEEKIISAGKQDKIKVVVLPSMFQSML